jgi:hypothetical protein
VKPHRWHIGGGKVLDYVDKHAPDEVYDAFYDLLDRLVLGPYPDDDPSLGVLPLQDPYKPNGFTAPFDGGLVCYQVTEDIPTVKLVDVFWMPRGDEPGWEYAF